MSPMSERWLPIAGFVGIYEVSDMGRVRCVRARQGVRLNQPTIGRKNRDGYMRVTLSNEPQPSIDKLVHILVLEAFVGSAGPGEECRHLNGDSTNNALKNLKWGTPLENADDKRRHGNVVKRERHGRAKLTDFEVAEIRASKISQRAIAAKFGISQQHVSDLKRGLKWIA